jgi:hypothetical protein
MDDIGDDTKPHSELVYRCIRSASAWIDRRAGWFIPTTETRRFDGDGTGRLRVDPLLAVTTIIDDATTLASTDYLLYPRGRHWENGPYTSIEIDPDSSRGFWTCERDVVSVAGRWGKYEESVTLSGVTVANTTQITDSGTTLKVSNGPAVSAGMVLKIESEQMLVTGISDLSAGEYTVKRAVNGTTAAAHANGVAVSRYIPPEDVGYLCRQMAAIMREKARSKFAGKVGNADLGEVFYFQEFPKDPIKEIAKNYRIVRL